MKKSAKLKAIIISLVTGLSSMASAMEANDGNYDTLVIGCRPWDKNIQGVGGLDTALFVDFRISEGPLVPPSNLLHLDVNDVGLLQPDENYAGGYSPQAGKFSEFTANCKEIFMSFKTIIIDWATYHHIRRDAAWDDFHSLLMDGGTLIVPVASLNLRTLKDMSEDKALELCGKLMMFENTQMYSYNDMPNEPRTQLLRRHANNDDNVTKPVIIYATK